MERVTSVVRRHWPLIVLRFSDKRIENDFRSMYRTKTLGQIQVSILIGMLLYGLFYLMDLAILDDEGLGFGTLIQYFPELFWTRVIVIGVGICIFMYSKMPDPKYLFLFCATGVLIGAIGILWMVSVITFYAPEHQYAYYQGILLVVVYGQIALRILFIYSWSTGAIILLSMFFWPVTEVDFFSFFHALCGFGVGTYGSWWMEKYARENYLSSRAQFAIKFYSWLNDKYAQLSIEQQNYLTEVVPAVVNGIQSNRKFKVSDLADSMHQTERALQLKFKEILHMTPSQLIEEVSDGLAAAAHIVGGESKESIYNAFGYSHSSKQKKLSKKISMLDERMQNISYFIISSHIMRKKQRN